MKRDLSLPVVLGQTAGQRFDCHSCTNCCREPVVALLPSDRERIDARNWTETLGVEPYVKLQGNWVLNKRADGACVFLEDDGKCRIHREHGRREKPLACQLFPFRIVTAAKEWRIGWRFDCPTVARSQGRPVYQHESEVRELASQLFAAASEIGGLAGETARSEETAAEAVVRIGQSWLGRADVPLHRQVSILTSLAAILADPTFGAVSGGKFAQLVESLGGGLGEAQDQTHEPPAPRQRAMLRLAAFVHCEHVSFDDARSSWGRLRLRWDQLRRARRFRRGQGMVPALVTGAHDFTFGAVESIAPARDEARSIEELLVRYLRVTLDSRAFYGPAYYGWSVREGLAALVLRLPVLGWLARYHAVVAGRDEIGLEDVVSALGRVDGAAGRVKSLGSAAERLRLTYLLRDRGFTRLATAYALTA